ncbi:MAG: hypothetical protein NTV22_11380 [bacterium]|nr:hypothetical protein [bacterium]
MALPTIDRNRTLTVYSKFDAGCENAVQIRNLSYSQMRRMMELQDEKADHEQLLRLWEMVVVHIDGVAYDQKQGEFGLCVAGPWASEHLPLRVISDLVQLAARVLVLGEDEKKASAAPSGSEPSSPNLTAPTAAPKANPSSEAA